MSDLIDKSFKKESIYHTSSISNISNIATNDLLSVVSIGKILFIKLAVSDYFTLENIKESLSIIATIIQTYNSQNEKIVWCWDLRPLSVRNCKPSIIEFIIKFFVKLGPLIRKTIGASACIFNNREITTIFNKLIGIYQPPTPCKVFYDSEQMAIDYLKTVINPIPMEVSSKKNKSKRSLFNKFKISLHKTSKSSTT